MANIKEFAHCIYVACFYYCIHSNCCCYDIIIVAKNFWGVQFFLLKATLYFSRLDLVDDQPIIKVSRPHPLQRNMSRGQ